MNQPETGCNNLSQKINSVNNLTYGQRASLCTNKTAQKLLTIMEQKKTNLAVAADVTSKKELLALADIVGPEICLLKTHIDIIDDFDQDLIEQLKKLATKHTFLLFEDRKFADIGNTTRLQYEGGMYRIADWADMITAHTVPGPGIIDGLKLAGLKRGRGVILLPQMSSKGTLAIGNYTQETIKMAQQHTDFVIGFIARDLDNNDPHFIRFTPGIKLKTGSDNLGQQYWTPERALKSGADIIIVGRGIYQSENPRESAQKYRRAGWQAYEQRIKT